MAKNWVQGGGLSMGTRQQVSAADSLPVQGRQLQGKDRSHCAQQDPASRHPELSLLFYQVRSQEKFISS